MSESFQEIGSNFYTDNIFSSDIINEQILKQKYPKAKQFIFNSLGRNSISLILESLNLKNKTAILPGYTCKEVMLPFITSNFNIIYYHLHKNLDVNIYDLETKIKIHNPSIILLHGYFGKNTVLPAKSIVKNAKKNGSIIIEDDTQTLFSNTDILDADFYIGSLRKWMSIPDGAFVCSTNSAIRDKFTINNEFVRLTLEAFELKSKYAKSLDDEVKKKYKKLYLDALNLIDNDPKIYAMSDISKGIFNNTDLENLKVKRLENYNYLHENILGNFKNISPVFKYNSDSDICPFYFPIYVEDRANFQKTLSDNNIFATLIWAKADVIPELDSETEFIYQKIIGIPCDQRYNVTDMERVVSVLKKYFI